MWRRRCGEFAALVMLWDHFELGHWTVSIATHDEDAII